MANKCKCTKAQLIEACKGSMGICESARKRLGISRRAFYNYRKRYPDVQQALDDELERGLDYAESQLMQLIQAKDFRAIAFYLERKGRERGWGQQQQVNVHNDTPLQPIICFEQSHGDESGDGDNGGGA